MPVIPHYKLTYFNMMGRAEPIRLIFAQAGVKYEDNRIEKQDWPVFKKSTPHGQLPVLEIDGKVLAQSRTIERFLGRCFGLAGNDDWEQARMDELVSCVDDLLIKMSPWFKEQDNAKKIEVFKALCDNEVIPFLTRFEDILENSGTGFFVGKELSYADLSIFHIFWFLNTKILPGALRKYPHLNAFVDKIASLPNIKHWIEERPKTEA